MKIILGVFSSKLIHNLLSDEADGAREEEEKGKSADESGCNRNQSKGSSRPRRGIMHSSISIHEPSRSNDHHDGYDDDVVRVWCIHPPPVYKWGLFLM